MKYLIVATVLALFTYLINTYMLIKLRSLGTRAYAAQVRWSSQPKPTIGGVSIAVGFILALAVLPWMSDPDLPQTMTLVALIAGALLAFGMGLTDDIRQTGPAPKFIVQVICGVLLWLGDVRIGGGLHPAGQAALTILWVVTLMNSVNMLDNMDGVSGGTVALTFLGLAFIGVPSFGGDLAFAMFGVLVGFLVLNVHPSKLFMGDSGSQLLGFLVAALSIMVVGGFEESDTGGGLLIPLKHWLALPILCATTLSDTALVTLNRLMHLRSPFKGGRDHSTHHLAYLGMGDRAIAFMFMAWSAVNGISVYFLLHHQEKATDKALCIVSIFSLGVFATLFVISRVNMRRRHFTYD